MPARTRKARLAAMMMLVAVLPVAFAPRAARAEPKATAGTAARTDRGRALPTALSVVPGALVHGAGHFAAGDAEGGRTLLLLEGLGLGAVGLGGVGLFASGASRKLVAPASILVLLGAGLFFVSWASDVWGTASGQATAADPEEMLTGTPLTRLPSVETSAGFRNVADPTFAHRGFFVNALDLRVGALRLHPEGWFGLGHPNERLKLLAAYRLMGPRPSGLDGRPAPRARDGSYVDIEGAVTRHAFPSERFTISAVELAVASRLDLARLHRTLRGSFGEGSLGYELAQHDYAVTGAYPDVTEQLLARFGWGVYLGRPGASRGPYGEVSTFYEHRHGGFVGGLKMPGLGSGVAGSFGARGVAWLTDELGLVADVQVGSAWVSGASIVVRQPVLP